jgi:hypothetical protein
MRWAARFLFSALATIVLLEIFRWVAREARLSEIGLGAFIAVLFEHLYSLSFVEEEVLKKMTVQSVLFPPASALTAILASIILWRIAKH